ncbi:MAG: type II secretion system F family protein [Sedimentisphaerales bacterium]|nr:type II secretion system F family protein [Sedimentisphaerales bacterium]
MASYKYTARDAAGSERAGTYTRVASVTALRQELKKLGYVLIRAERQRDATTSFGSVRSRDVVTFACKFAGMYTAGLPVLQCLETLEDQTTHAGLKRTLFDVRRRVETGSSLKQAFEPHRKVFTDFFLGMVEAGESAGKLSQSLELSARYLEKRQDLREKTRAAFVYPLVVGFVCSIVVTCLLIFVVPTFSQLYARLHVDIPRPTRALLALSFALRQGWWALLAAAVGVPLALGRLVKHPGAKMYWHRLRSRLPLVGPLCSLVSVSQFVRTLGMLISVGVPIIDALVVASNVAGNEEITRVTEDLQRATRAGRPVAESLGGHDVFPSTVVQLVASGEQAGILPEMLVKSAELLDKDIDRMTHALLVKLEPALTIVMGLVVGLILMGVYLPMFDYMACLK